jgi:hypothetical protein
MTSAGVLALSAAVLIPAAANSSSSHSRTAAAAVPSCSTVPVGAPSGARVESIQAVADPGGTKTFPDRTVTDVPAYCDVTVVLSHPGAGDRVTVKVMLPSDPADWTGRLQALGGSAYQAGDLNGSGLAAGVKDGYVTTTTDAGVSQNVIDASWGLKPDGTVNTGLLKNFASRSAHDMTVVAKNVARAYYGRSVDYAYWNGCSTGGRQGYKEAQSYPNDYDGILAAAPAVDWSRFAIGTLWSQAVFNEERVAPTTCEMAAFNTAAIKACEKLDGVADGIIDTPRDCHWDPRSLIGTKVQCEGQELTISAALADAVRKIWAGPTSPGGRQLWYGPNIGADFSYLATAGSPFIVADNWAKYFVAKDPAFDTKKLTYASFYQLFTQSVREYNQGIGTNDADLSAFRDAGGKLLSWHGQADQLVPTKGTVGYRNRVNLVMGGNARVNDFYRLFLLPGVQHCGGGTGPQAVDPLGTLVNWVEKGQRPATLATATTSSTGEVTATRNACSYPQVARYVGHGDPNQATSYRCAIK